MSNEILLCVIVGIFAVFATALMFACFKVNSNYEHHQDDMKNSLSKK